MLQSKCTGSLVHTDNLFYKMLKTFKKSVYFILQLDILENDKYVLCKVLLTQRKISSADKSNTCCIDKHIHSINIWYYSRLILYQYYILLAFYSVIQVNTVNF